MPRVLSARHASRLWGHCCTHARDSVYQYVCTYLRDLFFYFVWVYKVYHFLASSFKLTATRSDFLHHPRELQRAALPYWFESPVKNRPVKRLFLQICAIACQKRRSSGVYTFLLNLFLCAISKNNGEKLFPRSPFRNSRLVMKLFEAARRQLVLLTYEEAILKPGLL